MSSDKFDKFMKNGVGLAFNQETIMTLAVVICAYVLRRKLKIIFEENVGDNERIAESNSVKYLGVIIDSKLKFDGEVKKILQRMACGIKVLNTQSKSLPEETKILLLNAIVISHLHYSALILIGLQKSLLKTLEKQLNWGIKSIFNRRKYDRSTDLKLRSKILPVSFLLKYHCSKYFFAYSATIFQHIKLNISLP